MERPLKHTGWVDKESLLAFPEDYDGDVELNIYSTQNQRCPQFESRIYIFDADAYDAWLKSQLEIAGAAPFLDEGWYSL